MTRDWEIIRKILVRLEESRTPNSVVNMNSFPGLDSQAVAYNIRLLVDAGCIEAKLVNSSIGDGRIAAATATRLTDKGHDLLDTIRNDSVWSKIKQTLASKGFDLTVDLVLAVGKRIVESAVSHVPTL